MNSSDIVYIFTQIFKEDIVYDKQFDELFMNDNFDLFKYPIQIREIFYRYYPRLYARYASTLTQYDMKRLEIDIMNDDELKFIPLHLIDVNTILTKTFGKLLSQDYVFQNLKDQRERNHYTLEYVVRYNDGWNINKYLELGWVKPENVIHLKGAIDAMSEVYLQEYFNNAKAFDARISCDSLYKRFGFTDLKKFNENGIRIITEAFARINKYHPVIYQERFENTLFPEMFKLIKTKHLTQNEIQFLKGYFLREIRLDKELQNKDFNKTKSFEVYKIIVNANIGNDAKLTDLELLDNIYPKNSDDTSYDDVLNMFDTEDSNIDTFIQQFATEEYIYRHYKKWGISDPSSLYCGRSEYVFTRYNPCIPEIFKYITNNASYKYYKENIEEHSVNDFELIKNREPKFYRYFDYYNNNDIMTYIMNNADDTSKKYILEHYFDKHNKNLIPKEPNDAFVSEYINNYSKSMYKLMLLYDQYGSKELFDNIEFGGYWFEQMIARKIINKDNFHEFLEQHKEKIAIRNTLGFTWIKTYHEEPPFEIYGSPNLNVNGETNSSIWKRYVNENTVPMEMTSLNYYNYMIKTGGHKKNPNYTMMYTFFSNSLENKIIFCKSDIEFTKPAVERYQIPIQYDKLKPFLHEELETNNICMFCSIDKDDWDKIAGGNVSADVVCFSDCKNIYRERTPLKKVIEYIVQNIELKFDEECIEVDVL